MSVVNTMNSKRATDEIRHANDDLEYFYMEARRNKRMARWAAKQLDRNIEEYFLELITEDISQAGPKPVVDRIMEDFAEASIDISEEDIWLKLRHFEKEAFQNSLQDKTKQVKKDMKAKYKKKKKK